MTDTVVTCLIILGIAIVMLLLSFGIMYFEGRKNKPAYFDDGGAPGDMFVGNGIGFRILGSFSRDFANPVERVSRVSSKSESTSTTDDDFLSPEEESLAYVERHQYLHNLEGLKKRYKEDPEFANRQRKLSKKLFQGLDLYGRSSSYLPGEPKQVGYEFFCLIVPLFPVGCFAYTIVNSSARKTSYRFYGHQKWNFWEVLSIYLGGWSGVAIFGSIVGILWEYIF